jgi:hypothetical protein
MELWIAKRKIFLKISTNLLELDDLKEILFKLLNNKQQQVSKPQERINLTVVKIVMESQKFVFHPLVKSKPLLETLSPLKDKLLKILPLKLCHIVMFIDLHLNHLTTIKDIKPSIMEV